MNNSKPHSVAKCQHIFGTYAPEVCVRCGYRATSQQPSSPVSASQLGDEWRPMDTAPMDGTRILVDFGDTGVHAVAWEEAKGIEIWAVDDRKHGPFPLRGYSTSDILGWIPLPVSRSKLPKAAEPSAPKYEGDDLCRQDMHYHVNGICTACGQPESPKAVAPQPTDAQYMARIRQLEGAMHRTLQALREYKNTVPKIEALRESLFKELFAAPVEAEAPQPSYAAHKFVEARKSMEKMINEDNANVRLVRPVDRSLLGQEKPELVPLPITDDRNQDPAYAAWADVNDEIDRECVMCGFLWVTKHQGDEPCPRCRKSLPAPPVAEAPRVEGELPPRPKLQGGDYRPHYRQDQTDAYISALERIVKNSHGGAFLVEDLKKGLPELSLLAEEEEN